MEQLFRAIYEGSKAAQVTQDLTGRVYGLQFAVVADVEDPIKLGRVKVQLPSKGGRSLSDWMTRVMPWYGLSVPAMTLGTTVLVGFIDGDPHQGVYLGVIQNIRNPAYGADKWVYTTSNSQTAIESDGTLTHTVGGTKFTIDAQGGVSFTGVTSFTINGKEVATIDARDDEGDKLVTKGWS